MNIDTMRRLDYYAGVPLCFIGTVISKTIEFFKRGKKSVRPQNVLFVGLAEMGSVILADPAIMKLKQGLNINLHFAIFLKNSPSLELLNRIPRENIFLMEDSGPFDIVSGAMKFLVWTRKKRIDTVVDLDLFSRFTAFLSGFSGASSRVGFHSFYNEGLYRGDFLTHKVAYNPHQHISKNFIALVNALLSDENEIPFSKTVIPDEETKLQKKAVSEDETEAMRRKIRDVFPSFDGQFHKLVLFNTDSSDLVPLRRWPKEFYITLARRILSEYPQVVVLLTGNESERRSKDSIVEAVKSDRCVNFAGRTSIPELPALYSISSFMLTNDSGPAHFAALTDMPVFVFYGPETPALYGSLRNMTPLYSGLSCSPCVSAYNHRKTACRENICLRVITPQSVFETLIRSMGASLSAGAFPSEVPGDREKVRKKKDNNPALKGVKTISPGPHP